MIIDAHTHLHRTPDLEITKRNLLESMDRAGIDRAALFAFPSRELTNEDAIRIAGEHPDRFFAIGSVSPLAFAKRPTSVLDAQLQWWLHRRDLRGLKFYTGYEHFYADDVDLLAPYCAMVEKAGLPAIFHTGDTYNAVPGTRIKFAQPLPIDDLAYAFPKLKIIIAHLGHPWTTDAAEVVFRNPNVYADISGWVYGNFDDEDRAFLTRKLMDARSFIGGLDKMLFGSDWPISNQADYVRFVRELPITDEEKQKMFCDNARELFGV